MRLYSGPDGEFDKSILAVIGYERLCDSTGRKGVYDLKKAVSILLTIVMVFALTAAMAEPTKIDGLAQRNIKINKAGENTAPDGTSPTTGRSLAEAGKDVKDGFMGMAVTGQYMPLMVQVTNSGSGIGNRAPFFASYADVIYESPKDYKGITRLTMVYSDTIPEWVGCTRSMRVMHVWIREEWNAPIVYHGHQAAGDGNTDVSTAIRALGWHVPEAPNSPGASVFYDGMYPKEWNAHHYRVKSMGNIADNVVYYAPGILTDVVAKENIQPRNHTYLFTDTAPEGGDDAMNVYVSWNNTAVKTSEEKSPFYFNTMFEYDEEEGIYYRYILKDPENINAGTAVLYDEMAPVSVKKAGSGEVTADFTHGNPITFSNVIIQSVNIDWSRGNEMPVIEELGTGNADIFMGGKHYTGVWNRDTLTERTVFYDENGNEMPLMRGKTMIILMDYNREIREVTYE